MRRDNIPIAVVQLCDQVLDKSVRPDVRFNYLQTVRNVRDYCDFIIKEYEGMKK
jgi:hypothetical protein